MLRIKFLGKLKYLNKPSRRDLVVIRPRITGSVLQKDGKELWAISGQAIRDILKSLVQRSLN
jgi:hypothetical protein